MKPKLYKVTRHDRLSWISFNTSETIIDRSYCKDCGLPVAWTSSKIRLNPDGSRHRPTCMVKAIRQRRTKFGHRPGQ